MSSIKSLKEKNLINAINSRAESRNKLLYRGRICSSSDNLAIQKLPLDQFSNLCHYFVKQKKLENLTKLLPSLSWGDKYISTFLSIEGALYSLVGYLIGSDTEKQLQASYALISLSCGKLEESYKICKKTGAYLIMYLRSGNSSFQDCAAWACGNLAGDNAKVCELLQSQGIEQALVHALRSHSSNTLQSTCFALTNYLRTVPHRIPFVWSAEVLSILQSKLSIDENEDVCWCLFSLSTNRSAAIWMAQNNVVSDALKTLHTLSTLQLKNNKAKTALIRILINCLASQPACVQQILFEIEIFSATCESVSKGCDYHIKKETLQCIANVINQLHGTDQTKVFNLLTPALHNIGPMLINSL